MRNSYIEILSQKVEIPIIQRDYAQGRIDSKASKVRKDFLDTLFEFIQQKAIDSNAVIELDFIYGFTNENEKHFFDFVPIDGQQRLTTLWLLYWYVAVAEDIDTTEKSFLSNFVYETRHSTTQFCKELIRFTTDCSDSVISDEIKNQSWYFETWDYDPSIQAMLVMLDDIQRRYKDLQLNLVWQLIGNTSCPFYFYKLDMKKVGLTDDLYIKMNSRGKALTEFEYFKAGFSDIIVAPALKERFEKSVDGNWIDSIWQIVFESRKLKHNDDVALTVDNAFLNLFNFITSVIAFRKEIRATNGSRYIDTVSSAELLEIIYNDDANLLHLFDSFDAICNQLESNKTFWTDTFYFEKDESNLQKARLFFQHNEPNLLKRCLFNYSENRGLSFPEQLLLLSCITQFKNPQSNFVDRIRVVRNLVVNSSNELRESFLGSSFDEVEHYILNGDLNVLKYFKTDQIEEEKQKAQFIGQSPLLLNVLRQLEDSDVFRGSVSLFPLDDTFSNRAKMFLALFDEDEFLQQFTQKVNLLQCFGDYSQNERSLVNFMAASKDIIRGFLTTPGYNKLNFYGRTRSVIMDCLDFFNLNTKVTPTQKIDEVLTGFKTAPKDWPYYFMQYASFKEQCHYGFYAWRDDNYCIWKMGRKQFNGYHWDPFLHEVLLSLKSSNLSLNNYGAKLLLNLKANSYAISSVSNGFLFEDLSGDLSNSVIAGLKSSQMLNASGILEIQQNDKGIDLEDRLVKLKQLIKSLIK